MRSFLLAAKIAAVFTVVMLTALALTLLLFLRVAGHETMRDLGLLLAHQGVAVAEELDLSHCAVGDLEPLRAFTKLTTLLVCHNARLTSKTRFPKLPRLHTLYGAPWARARR